MLSVCIQSRGQQMSQNKNKSHGELSNSIQCMSLLKKFNSKSTLVDQIKTVHKDVEVSKKHKKSHDKKKT